MHLDLKHLRTLSELRDAGNLNAAAQRLHVTPSALSHQLATLEQALGVQLFQRKSRPLSFTAAGLRLLEAAADILPRMRELEHSLRQLARGESGRLHVAVECHSCFDWLLPVLDDYRETWPQIELDLALAYPFEPLPALLRGEIDLVITADPQSLNGVSYAALFGFDILLALAPDHPLCKLRYIEPAHLRDETLITYPVARERLDVFKRFLQPAGVEPGAHQTTEHTALMLQQVANRRGVCTVPSWVLANQLEAGRLCARPLGRRGLHSTLQAAVRTAEAGLPQVTAFIERARAGQPPLP